MTLEVPDTVRARLELLKAMSEATSITEVIRRALAVYEVALEVEIGGGRVIAEPKDGGVPRQILIR